MASKGINIQSFTFGPFQTNTYVVTVPGEEGDRCLIIDPACFTEYEKQALRSYIGRLENGSTSVRILATHGHLDHLWGAAWACAQWQTPVILHEADIPMAEAMQTQYDLFGIGLQAEPFPIEPISNLKSQISNLQFEILSTPGHTPGSICLYFPEDEILFSGDTLFHMGYGRTDLPGGNYAQLMDSLHRLLALPPQTQVLSGHGEASRIAWNR